MVRCTRPSTRPTMSPSRFFSLVMKCHSNARQRSTRRACYVMRTFLASSPLTTLVSMCDTCIGQVHCACQTLNKTCLIVFSRLLKQICSKDSLQSSLIHVITWSRIQSLKYIFSCISKFFMKWRLNNVV